MVCGRKVATSEVKQDNGSFLEMRQPNGKIRRAAAGGSPNVMDSLDKKFYYDESGFRGPEPAFELIARIAD
jgi:hypothetical protein